MRATATIVPAVETDADVVIIGHFEGEGIPHDVDGGALQALVDAGEARTSPRSLAVTHAAGKRWILVGLGRREDYDDERLRIAAAVAHGRARELGGRVVAW